MMEEELKEIEGIHDSYEVDNRQEGPKTKREP